MFGFRAYTLLMAQQKAVPLQRGSRNRGSEGATCLLSIICSFLCRIPAVEAKESQPGVWSGSYRWMAGNDTKSIITTTIIKYVCARMLRKLWK